MRQESDWIELDEVELLEAAREIEVIEEGPNSFRKLLAKGEEFKKLGLEPSYRYFKSKGFIEVYTTLDKLNIN